MAETNPFAALLTPDTLQRVREAELDEKYKGAGFWGREMARAGGTIRQRLREQGVGLTADDRRAALNQSILQSSGQFYSKAVADGMDPDEARVNVLDETVRQFMAAGEYASALSLVPQIEELKKIRAERRKINSEAAYNETIKGEVEQAKAEAAVARARAAGTTAGAAVTRADAAAARVDSQNAVDDASARLKDRTDPNLRGGKGGSGNRTANPSEVAKFNGQVAGGLGLLSRAKQYRDLVVNRPAVTAPPAQWKAWLDSQAKGFLNSIGGGVSPDALSAEDRQAYAASASKAALLANKLRIDVGSFRSLSLDLAFAIAKARDPGGRLSNQDFDTALAILGGDADAQTALRTLDRTVRNSLQDVINHGRGSRTLREDVETFQELEAGLAEWEAGFTVPKKETAKERAKRLGIE